MRAFGLGLAVLAVSAAPAFAQQIQTSVGHIVSYATSDFGGSGIPIVTRGAEFAIACDSIRSNAADVSVVMSLDGAEQPTGYSAVLATNQKVARHGVRVQVPDLPDIANHTVDVKVYVTDAKGTHACDAGRVRIV